MSCIIYQTSRLGHHPSSALRRLRRFLTRPSCHVRYGHYQPEKVLKVLHAPRLPEAVNEISSSHSSLAPSGLGSVVDIHERA